MLTIDPRSQQQIEAELKSLNSTLADYALVQTKLTTAEVLEKKGRDLAIKIFQGFWALRTKASKNQRNGLVLSGPMFAAAAARGWRTKLRPGGDVLQGEYASLYASMVSARLSARVKGKMSAGRALKGYGGMGRALLVAQELATRQRGAGLLGVSFLFNRWAKNSAANNDGRYLVKNVSGNLGLLSSVEQGTDAQGGQFFKLTNQTPGVAMVDGQKGILASALAQVRADTLIYLVRKQNEALIKALSTRQAVPAQ